MRFFKFAEQVLLALIQFRECFFPKVPAQLDVGTYCFVWLVDYIGELGIAVLEGDRSCWKLVASTSCALATSDSLESFDRCADWSHSRLVEAFV